MTHCSTPGSSECVIEDSGRKLLGGIGFGLFLDEVTALRKTAYFRSTRTAIPVGALRLVFGPWIRRSGATLPERSRVEYENAVLARLRDENSVRAIECNSAGVDEIRAGDGAHWRYVCRRFGGMNRDRRIRAHVRDVDASVDGQRHLLGFAEAHRDLGDGRHVAIGIRVEPQEFALAARAERFGTRHDVDRTVVIESHSAGDIETRY